MLPRKCYNVPDGNTKIRLIRPDSELQYREYYINFNYSFACLSNTQKEKKAKYPRQGFKEGWGGVAAENRRKIKQ